VTASGSIDEVVRTYEERMSTVGEDRTGSTQGSRLSSHLVIDEVAVLGPTGEAAELLETGAAGSFRIRCTATQFFERLTAGIIIRGTGEGTPLVVLDAALNGTCLSLEPGTTDIIFEMPAVALRPGRYRAKIAVARTNLDLLDVVEAFPFRVSSSGAIGTGQFFQVGRWQCRSVLPPVSSVPQVK
jgi:hypothetical protein